MTPSARILVGFHSSQGQTPKIAEHIGDILILRGARVDVVDAGAERTPDAYDGVVLGDSIHMGHHSSTLVEWLRRHAADLGRRRTALYQVSVVSENPDSEHAAAERLVLALRDQTGFAPDVVAMFAGAPASTRYEWLTRRVLGTTDTSCGHEYTDWADVEHFASGFYELVAARPGRAAGDGATS